MTKHISPILFLSLITLFCTCQSPPDNESYVADIISSLNEQHEHQYTFNYTFRDFSTDDEPTVISGLNSIKRKEAARIQNAYFTLNDSSSINYVQIIKDGDLGIERVKSQVIQENAALHLADTILSPVLMNPNWLANTLEKSTHQKLIVDRGRGLITLTLDTKNYTLQLVWSKPSEKLIAVSLSKKQSEKIIERHDWAFHHLAKEAYAASSKSYAYRLKNQPNRFL